MSKRSKAPTYRCPHCSRDGVRAAKGLLLPHMTPGGLRCSLAPMVAHLGMIEEGRRAQAGKGPRRFT